MLGSLFGLDRVVRLRWMRGITSKWRSLMQGQHKRQVLLQSSQTSKSRKIWQVLGQCSSDEHATACALCGDVDLGHSQSGSTPLSLAASGGGHDATMRQLLDTSKINVDGCTNTAARRYGWLHSYGSRWWSGNCWTRVRSTKNENGRTPPSWAA